MNFKKVFLGISLLITVSSTMVAQTEGIAFFHGSWAETVAKAKTENKLIFIDFYTQWCGPCMNMAEQVFVLPTVGSFYNSHFINAKIDAENGEGVQLAKKYQVRSFPTYIYVDPNTEDAVHRSSSRQEAQQFIQTGLSATVPNRRSFYLIEEYTKGNRDKQLVIDYINYHHSIYQRAAVTAAFNELIKGGAKLTEPEIWTVFVNVISGMDNPYLKQVSDNYAQFCQLFGKKEVDAKLTKETTYGDLALLDSFCDFEGKSFNRQMIVLNQILREENYDKAAQTIDGMIANPQIDQQELINRLKFIARLPRGYKEIPEAWFLKCVEYLQYIAYNMKDRSDPYIHQEYAAALEDVIRKMQTKKEAVPASIMNQPNHGKKEYTMRPDALKPKPKK